MKHNVHVYCTVRIKMLDVEADSQAEAARKGADAAFELGHDLFDRDLDRDGIDHVEFAEEVTGAFVLSQPSTN